MSRLLCRALGLGRGLGLQASRVRDCEGAAFRAMGLGSEDIG